jgi:hypothetical protein
MYCDTGAALCVRIDPRSFDFDAADFSSLGIRIQHAHILFRRRCLPLRSGDGGGGGRRAARTVVVRAVAGAAESRIVRAFIAFFGTVQLRNFSERVIL